jgi:CzcA family heavy metal efflux pump
MKLFDFIVGQVLKNRIFVLLGSAALMIYGTYVMLNVPVDILPDLNRPTVTIFTEAEGFAAEEVELLVSTPIESVMNGAPGVQRVRSISAAGLSLVFVEFEWGQDIYIARQIVSEKLQAAALPDEASSQLGPISSIMGEIQLIGISSKNGETTPKNLRNIAEWTIRPKLLTVPGVAAVTLIGGEIQEYQIKIDPIKLSNYQLTISEVEEKIQAIVENKGGGYITTDTVEYPVRIIGRTSDIKVLADTVVAQHENTFVLLKDIAKIEIGSQTVPRGDASINNQPGVIASITKQPGINTLELTERIEEALTSLGPALGADIEIHTDLFKQEKFIRNGIDNVIGATRDGAILVVLVLILFLGNLRALAITLVALPFSFVTAIVILQAFGIGINVMTLGGLAVAIGELTDDAVVGVENTIRWLKDHQKEAHLKHLSILEVILRASSQVRGSIVFSTMLVVIVFMPLFALGNIEGRLLAPLAISYIVALLASTIVAMTISVVMCYYLLPGTRMITEGLETKFVKWVKRKAEPIIRWNIRNAKIGLIIGAVSIVLSALLIFQAGKEFLPPFNEGTLTIGVALPPGSSLDLSNQIGKKIESALLQIPGIKSTARRTGRAEEDEHANGVEVSELEVDIDLSERKKDEIIADVKAALSRIDLQKANVTIGQPISHRIEHILSGVRAPLVIKLFGSDLDELRVSADKIRDMLEEIPGTLNPVVDQEVKVPQVTITPDRERAAQYGFTFAELTDTIETLLAGEEIGRILEGNKSYKLVVRLDEGRLQEVSQLRHLLLYTPQGNTIPLSAVADVREIEGRNSISHDNGQRRLVISSGILDGDSVTIIETLKQRIQDELTLPPGYFLSYEGTYQSQQESSRSLLFFTFIAFIAILLVLYYKFRSVSFVLQILANIPVTYLGAMIGVLLTGNVMSLASLVGLISVLGLATRNGILLIEYWLYQATEEGVPFGEELIVKGSLNRLVPMLMTALTSLLALIPLLLSPDDPGKELLYPLAVTTFGGLIVSTLVEIIIRPGMFKMFGEKPLLKAVSQFKQKSV